MTTLTSLSGQSANAPKQSAGTGKIVFFLRSPATNASSCAKYGFCTSFASTCSQAGGSESPCFARSARAAAAAAAGAAVVDRAAEAEAEAKVEEEEDEEEDDEDEDEDALVVFARFGAGPKNELILPDFRESDRDSILIFFIEMQNEKWNKIKFAKSSNVHSRRSRTL